MNDEKEWTKPRIRLELMRMAYRHDKTPQDLVQRVRELEDYVMAADDPVSSVKAGKATRKAPA